MTSDTGFATFNCHKEFRINFPDLCQDPKDCNAEVSFESPKCESIGFNQLAYQVPVGIYNNFGTTATTTFTAPNGEGYFVPNTLTLPQLMSNQILTFYPNNNGYHGGSVVIAMLVHFNDDICYREQEIKFDDCCLLCPTPVEETGKVMLETTAENVLRVAPNPAKAVTTIFYNFVKDNTAKKIELLDVLGRTLQSWTPTDNSGKIELDCTRYANGQYLILMKEDGEIIEKAKLITN